MSKTFVEGCPNIIETFFYVELTTVDRKKTSGIE